MASFTPRPQTRRLQEADEAQDREATEMQGTSQHASHHGANGSPSLSAPVVALSHQIPSLRITIDNFWRRQIIATVSHKKCRDHFGMKTCVSNFFTRLWLMLMTSKKIYPALTYIMMRSGAENEDEPFLNRYQHRLGEIKFNATTVTIGLWLFFWLYLSSSWTHVSGISEDLTCVVNARSNHRPTLPSTKHWQSILNGWIFRHRNPCGKCMRSWGYSCFTCWGISLLAAAKRNVARKGLRRGLGSYGHRVHHADCMYSHLQDWYLWLIFMR